MAKKKAAKTSMQCDVMELLEKQALGEEMRLNNDVGKMKVGDLVVSDYCWSDKNVIRKITRICKVAKGETGSNYRASADDGGVCPTCKRPLGKAIEGVDAAWFIPVKSKEE
jgi:hypothetical protein